MINPTPILLQANALSIPLPDQSVHCVITSPPYWNQRNYGISGQLGLEKTLEGYIDNMRIVFREVWRVLRDDGQLFINISDTRSKDRQWLGVPHRLVLTLQADGWRWEDEIVWAKKNPMPSNQTNRFTRSHELVYMLNKSKVAFFDLDAVREAHKDPARWLNNNGPTTAFGGGRIPGAAQEQFVTGWRKSEEIGNPGGRKRNTVWSIAIAPYSAAHFATFPPKLVEPMIKTGTSERGCCPECGAQWERQIEVQYINPGNRTTNGPRSSERRHESPGFEKRLERKTIDLGFTPTCSHDHTPIPCTILDPFVGSGTTLQVARMLGRHGVGIDLSAEYLKQAKQRLQLDKLERWGKGIEDPNDYESLALFNPEVVYGKSGTDNAV